jgi:hypothetical protein
MLQPNTKGVVHTFEVDVSKVCNFSERKLADVAAEVISSLCTNALTVNKAM